MSTLGKIRAFARGELDATSLTEAVMAAALEDEDILDIENDEEFMQEAMSVTLPFAVQDHLIDDDLDDITNECITRLSDYFVGQGLISEAAANPTNPKISFVRLNKAARHRRLSRIFALMLARRDNQKAYKKYKIGQQLKKTNMAEIVKRYGAKAEKLAKKAMAKSKRGNKIVAVTDNAKTNKPAQPKARPASSRAKN